MIPSTPSEHVRNIALDLVFTILTCGLYNLVVQYKQMGAVNAMVKEEKYVFLHWLILTLITCGLYHVYHEYRKTLDIGKVLGSLSPHEPILTVVLTCFGFHIVADAIQQTHINQYYGSTKL